MKIAYISIIATAILLLSFLTACRSDGPAPIPSETSSPPTITETSNHNIGELIPTPEGSLPEPTGPEAPDDIVHTPGGDAYQANVHQEGVPDKWPSIQTVIVKRDNLQIQYREEIETRAEETRNNIIAVYGGEAVFDSKLVLYSSVMPDGIKLTDVGGGGRPGMLLAVVAIEISPSVIPGQYTFSFSVEIDGKDYGTLPCTINVIE
jgi:hypothetical protein